MRCRAAFLALLFCLFAGAAAAQPAVLVLDGSSSMWGRIGTRSKVDIVRDAVAGLMSRWAAARPVGLVAYGHRRAQDCADIEMLRAPATNAAGIVALTQRITPRGRTPMADAVRLAAEALGPGGGSIILVTDGIETCHPDPCAVAQQIARSGVRLVVHTVAFALADPAALAQLRCMAQATGGLALAAPDAENLATALDRAAAMPTPGPRAAAPRAEPVPQPRLVVTLRLCPQCDPMTGDARIILRRGEEVVATDGEPFGRFFDLPAGDYTVAVEATLFHRAPVPVSVPPAGLARAEIVLDAGWLVAEARTAPSGNAVPPAFGVEWAIASGPSGSEAAGAEVRAGPVYLVPAGAHRLRARLGNAQAAAEAVVAAGEVVTRRLAIPYGVLALEGTGAASITITALDRDPAVFGEWHLAEAGRIPLAPGRYLVTADRDGRRLAAEVEIRGEMVVEPTLEPRD
ncbi:VWA domain-containing protein [Roseomonas eburnea]|uniref:VWA domain-containing protein n=1 Tax=Neoroseomonas eburnea TaxID=1346889 RepID=A0A9X9XJI9_9PROT|nr:VWA domain-containing protein [Neoroseomonas eburnea]MBR0683875.1 VWA domain-containing protein [Neoroseomonas eburnea]